MSVERINTHGLQMVIEDKSGAFLDELGARAAGVARAVAKRRVGVMQAAAPVLTGRFKRGITSEVKKTATQITVQIGGKDQKTHWIEYGTRKQAPRPVIAPGFEGIEGEFEAGLVAEAEGIKV